MLREWAHDTRVGDDVVSRVARGARAWTDAFARQFLHLQQSWPVYQKVVPPDDEAAARRRLAEWQR